MISIRNITCAPAVRSAVRSPAVVSKPFAFTAQARHASAASNGAKPKILNEKPPSEEEQSKEVREHNEDVAKRADKTTGTVASEQKQEGQGKQAVDKGFWKGHGGVDKDS